MILLSRHFIFNRNSQALPAEALLPSVRPAKSESEHQLIAIELNLLNLGFSKNRINQLKHKVLTKISDLEDQEKKTLMLQLIKLKPEYNWEHIFLDSLLSITIIGLLVVIPRLTDTTRYFLSPERQARSIILDEIKNSSTTALSY